MKLNIILALLCALFCEVTALTCYQCIPDASQTCTNTKIPCSPGSCASASTVIYGSDGEKILDSNLKSCYPSDQCVSGTVNFGVVRSITNTKCCATDLCNSENAPVSNINTTLNGKKCFTCEGDDCNKTLSCMGDEDLCIKASTELSGQKVTVKGCASKSICEGDFSAQLSSMAMGLSCCEGNLCNGAKHVGGSVLLLLGSVVSVLLFH